MRPPKGGGGPISRGHLRTGVSGVPSCRDLDERSEARAKSTVTSRRRTGQIVCREPSDRGRPCQRRKGICARFFARRGVRKQSEGRPGNSCQDRKSTRLNSSHLV